MKHLLAYSAARRPSSKSGSALLAAVAALILLPGCQQQKTATARKGPSPAAGPTPKPVRSHQAVIYEDEAMLKGSEAVIGGKVENVSGADLQDLYVELRLVRRGGGGAETREINLTPSVLRPGERGSYSITISNHAWGSASLVSLKSRGPEGEIAYKSEPGAQRPPERLASKKVVVVSRPKSKGGDDFINTPDDPEVIR